MLPGTDVRGRGLGRLAHPHAQLVAKAGGRVPVVYSKKHLGPLIMIALGIAGICAVVGLAIDWLPKAISPEAERIDTLMWFLYWASVFFFSIVVAVIIYSVWKFRRQPGDDTDGPPTHGNTALEIVWTVVPALLLAAVGAWSIVVLNKNEASAANSLRIVANGEQFAWRFDYAAPGSEKGFRTGDLYVPVNRPIDLRITASDVIHDFWVPEIRVKQDATPGVNTYVKFTPTEVGTYPVICAELCGSGHAQMRTQMHVLTQVAYDAWFVKATAEAAAAK